MTSDIPSDVFKNLIRNMNKKYDQRVAVLIDEYDKPILDHLDDAEVSVSKGRIDAVLELDDKVYIVEFKYKDCKQGISEKDKRDIAEAALDEGLNQIKDRGYHKKYIGCGKTIYHVAFVFLGRDDIEMRVV